MGKYRRPLIICCVVSAILLVILIVTAVTFYFTVFKPKQPKITTQSITLDSFSTNLFDISDTNATLGIVVTVYNPNYGGFIYGNSTTRVTYHGELVAEAPITADSIPARGGRNVSTEVLVIGKNLVTNPNFIKDLDSRVLNFTSMTTLKGKAVVLNLFKRKATSVGLCAISINLVNQNATSVCTSKVTF